MTDELASYLFENKEKIPDGVYLELMNKMKNIEINKKVFYEVIYYKPEVIQSSEGCEKCEKNIKHNCDWDYQFYLTMKETKIITELTDFQLKRLEQNIMFIDFEPIDILSRLNGAYIVNECVKKCKSDAITHSHFIVKSWKKL